MVQVGRFPYGAKAPSSPFIVDGNIFSNPDYDTLFKWYYTKSNTLDITYREIDYHVFVIDIAEQYGEIIKVSSITLGEKQVDSIRREYQFYHKNR